MKTTALAAYIQSRNAKFAGAPITLKRLLQMAELPHDGASETISGVALEAIARYCKLTPAELAAAVKAMPRPVEPEPEPEPEPVPEPEPFPKQVATVTIPPLPEAAPIVIESVRPSLPEPTTVMPREQLDDLVAASRKSNPVIEAPSVLPEEEADTEVSFRETKNEPVAPPPVKPSTKSSKSSSKSRKPKKSK